jgi:hypothetical protein
MWYITGSLFVLGLLAAGFSLWEERRRRTSETGDRPEDRVAGLSECCGQHAVCERGGQPATVRQPEYYDDEELDVYCGTASEAYTDDATEAFREVLYTLREAEVSGWLRSLQLRGISLPDTLKDEAFLIIGEQNGRQVSTFRIQD